MKGINCPHCSSHTKGEINCRCGYEEDKFKGDVVIHIKHFAIVNIPNASSIKTLGGG